VKLLLRVKHFKEASNLAEIAVSTHPADYTSAFLHAECLRCKQPATMLDAIDFCI
jgi:hypothetical protein